MVSKYKTDENLYTTVIIIMGYTQEFSLSISISDIHTSQEGYKGRVSLACFRGHLKGLSIRGISDQHHHHYPPSPKEWPGLPELPYTVTVGVQRVL